MARALTSGEKASLRSGQACIPLLDIDAPGTVFTCRVNQSFSTLDIVSEITYDGGSGTYTDILPGMTLLVGSAAGLADVGMARIRAAASATKLYIGDNADIAWADNLYLTVLSEWLIWSKPALVDSSGVLLMDHDTAYSDQHASLSPVIVAGPPRRVAKLTGANVDVVFDLSDSWVLGSSLSSYATVAPGSASITDGTTDHPTITYDAAGRYYVKFTVTAANGKSSTAYRTVRIWSDAAPLVSDFVIESCQGSYQNGGWECSVVVYGDYADIRAMAMVTLAARDFYNDVETSIGPVEGCENMVMTGWVSGESIKYDPNGGEVRFTVKGPHWWMSQLAGVNVQLTNVSGTPAGWGEMQGLTLDQALYHLVVWRSTVAAVLDVYKSADTRLSPSFEAASMSLWQTLVAFADKIFAKPCCDRYGRLYVQIDPQLTEAGDRSGFPSVMTLEEGDWLEDGVQITRNYAPQNASINMSTWMLSAAGSTVKTLYHLSPGHIPERLGMEMILDNYLSASQSQGNSMAGLYLGATLNELTFDIELAMNNRAVDICPAQTVEVDIAAADTVRGEAYDGNIVVREVRFNFDKKAFVLTSWTAEQESVEQNSVDGDIPIGDGFSVPDLPKLPKLPELPALEPVAGLISEEELEIGPSVVIIATSNFGVLYSSNFNETDPEWYFMNDGLTEDQYKNVRRIIRTPSGALFALIADPLSTTGADYVFWASGVGSSWTMLMDTSGLSGSISKLIALGYNPDLPEEIAVASGSTSDDSGALYTGDRDGLSELANGIDAVTNQGDISIGMGKWYLSHAERSTFKNQAFTVVTEAGAIEENTTNYTNGDTASASRQLHRRGGGIVYSWNNHADYLRKIEDNDGAASDTTQPNVGGTGNAPYCLLDVDPTGQYLMGGVAASLFKRSSDYGVTWGTVDGSMGLGFAAVGNCGTSMAWIAGGVATVKYTPDWGDTWVSKTGNLSSLASLCNINHVLFVSW